MGPCSLQTSLPGKLSASSDGFPNWNISSREHIIEISQDNSNQLSSSTSSSSSSSLKLLLIKLQKNNKITRTIYIYIYMYIYIMMIITEHYNHDDSLRQHELYSLYTCPICSTKVLFSSSSILYSSFCLISFFRPSRPLASDT